MDQPPALPTVRPAADPALWSGEIVPLPVSRALSALERDDLDRALGVSPLAVAGATPRRISLYELGAGLLLTVLVAGTVLVVMPWSRFVSPRPGTLSDAPAAAGPLDEREVAALERSEDPGARAERVLLRADAAAAAGRVSEALRLAEEIFPPGDAAGWPDHARLFGWYCRMLDTQAMPMRLRRAADTYLSVHRDALEPRFWAGRARLRLAGPPRVDYGDATSDPAARQAAGEADLALRLLTELNLRAGLRQEHGWQPDAASLARWSLELARAQAQVWRTANRPLSGAMLTDHLEAALRLTMAANLDALQPALELRRQLLLEVRDAKWGASEWTSIWTLRLLGEDLTFAAVSAQLRKLDERLATAKAAGP